MLIETLGRRAKFRATDSGYVHRKQLIDSRKLLIAVWHSSN